MLSPQIHTNKKNENHDCDSDNISLRIATIRRHTTRYILCEKYHVRNFGLRRRKA